MARLGRFQRATVTGWHAAWEYEPQLTAAYATLLRQAADEAADLLPRVALAAAGRVKGEAAPKWSKPNEDELGERLRAIYKAERKTEPIRVEAMRAAASPPLQVIGLSFSLTNPFIRDAILQAGGKITDIVETTRRDLARVLDDAWRSGLSIPHTADALRAYGVDNARATLIARTELIGISNGGSHAAALTANAESTDPTSQDGLPPLYKIWLTAEDELVRDTHVDAGDQYGEGNGIPLDDLFLVGDSELEYPGDQNGSPEEVCNCRCAISYEEGEPLTAAGRRRYRGGRMSAKDTMTPAGLPEGAVPIGQAIAEAGEFVSCLCIEGMQTADSRFLALGSIGHRPLPLTLTVQLVTADGHNEAHVAGKLTAIEKMPVAQALAAGLVPDGRDYPPDAVAVIGYGCFDQGGYGGMEAERLVASRDLRGVSIELAVEEGELVELAPEPGQEIGDLLDVVVLGEIAAACIVAFPAFAEAQIMLATQAAAGGLVLDDADGADAEPAETAEDAVAASGAWRFSVVTASPVQLMANRQGRTFAAVDHSAGSMIAVHPTSQEAMDCAQAGGQPAGDLHVTLAYLPSPPDDMAPVHDAVRAFAAGETPISGQVGGAGYFAAAPPIPPQPEGGSNSGKADEVIEDTKPDAATTAAADTPPPAPQTDSGDAHDGDLPEQADQSPEDTLPDAHHPHVALVDAPGLAGMRQRLCDQLDAAGVDYAQNHDFVPHMTLGYEPEPGVPAMHLAGKPLTFSAISVHDGPNRTDHPMEPDGALTASAAGAAPERPPAAWFDDPGLDEPTPMTVTAEGQVYGHLATWGTCHVGIMDACVRPPRNQSGYRMFHLGEVETDDGEMIATGVLTMDTGHADLRLNAGATKRHYDDTGVGAIDCVVGEDRHGIWMAGAVRPELDMAAVRRLRASKPSGDWRTVGGAFEMVGLLAVNTPGFPVPRPTARVLAASAGGERVTALVAAGIDLRPSDDSATRPAELWRLLDRALPGSSASRVEALAASVL